MSTHAPPPTHVQVPNDAQFAIVAARFNAHLTDVLLAGCVARFAEANISGGRLAVHRVPGAFELPVAAKALADTGRYAAVVCIGCVIRGDTPHFEYVSGETARGIQQVAIDTGVPIIFGVLTTNTAQQALDRAGGPQGHAGRSAADAAMEMASLVHRVRHSHG